MDNSLSLKMISIYRKGQNGIRRFSRASIRAAARLRSGKLPRVIQRSGPAKR